MKDLSTGLKLKKLFQNKLLLLFSLLTFLYLFFAILFKQYSDLWWDSASYIGMGKYIFSFGEQGVFEPMKSVFLPLFLGLFWKIGFNVVYFGKIFVFLMGMCSLLFLYLISKELFDEKTGLVASLLLFFNVLFFVFLFRIYTEMLSVCFILGAIFFMLKFSRNKKYLFLFLSALFCVFSFLSKYPNILIFGILNLFLIFKAFKTKKISYFMLFNLFFLILVSPFLILNYVISGDAFYLMTLSQEYFKANLGNLYSLRSFPGIPRLLFENTHLIYFKSIFYLFNILLPFMFFGIYRIFKEKENRNEKFFLLLLPAVLFFCFFEIFHLKQERYLLPIFPMLALFSAYGLLKIKNKKVFLVILAYILASFIGPVIFYSNFDERAYTEFFINPPVDLDCEKVATSDPRSVMKYRLIFPYEVFYEDWDGENIIRENPDCIFYFSCYGERERHIGELNEMNYSLEYSKDTGRCLYAIFKK